MCATRLSLSPLSLGGSGWTSKVTLYSPAQALTYCRCRDTSNIADVWAEGVDELVNVGMVQMYALFMDLQQL